MIGLSATVSPYLGSRLVRMSKIVMKQSRLIFEMGLAVDIEVVIANCSSSGHQLFKVEKNGSRVKFFCGSGPHVFSE